jgi:hypothetical protein
MTETVDQKQKLELLDQTLEAYGANASRWPDGVRDQLMAFTVGNSAAQKRIAAARALDTVLGFAPRLSEAQNTALASRIIDRAVRQPRAVTATDAAPPQRRWLGRSNGMAAAAMAASLLIGVLAGQNPTFSTFADAIVGGTDASAGHGQQIALGDDADTLLDEDLL